MQKFTDTGWEAKLQESSLCPPIWPWHREALLGPNFLVHGILTAVLRPRIIIRPAHTVALAWGTTHTPASTTVALIVVPLQRSGVLQLWLDSLCSGRYAASITKTLRAPVMARHVF